MATSIIRAYYSEVLRFLSVFNLPVLHYLSQIFSASKSFVISGARANTRTHTHTHIHNIRAEYLAIFIIYLYLEYYGPGTGHLAKGFSRFPCLYKQMLRWFPTFQVATTCFSCSPPDLNLLVTSFIFCVHVK